VQSLSCSAPVGSQEFAFCHAVKLCSTEFQECSASDSLALVRVQAAEKLLTGSAWKDEQLTGDVCL
jgi:hypothetical protein